MIEIVNCSIELNAFLSFLRTCEETNRLAILTENDMDRQTQDILHNIELNENSQYDYICQGFTLRDIRRKRRKAKDIRDMTDNDIQNLYKLPTVFFVYKPGYLEKDSAVPIPGLYAEDVEQYLPLAARYQNGLIEDWNERAVIPYLIKAIQLQHEEIEALKRKVA